MYVKERSESDSYCVLRHKQNLEIYDSLIGPLRSRQPVPPVHLTDLANMYILAVQNGSYVLDCVQSGSR